MNKDCQDPLIRVLSEDLETWVSSTTLDMIGAFLFSRRCRMESDHIWTLATLI